MKQTTQSHGALRQRKFLLILPLLAIPFITLLFWAMGGGKVDDATAQQAQKGFNSQLPGANLKDDHPLDKMSYYDKAASDSLKLEQLMKNDPYYRQKRDTDSVATSFMDTSIGAKYGSINESSTRSSGYTDPNEVKVYRKLAQLNEAMNKTGAPQPEGEKLTIKQGAANSNDIERLEQMMNAMNGGDAGDPEMQQLSNMLEQIQEIQNPNLVQQKLLEQSRKNRGQVYSVTSETKQPLLSTLDSGSKQGIFTGTVQENGFYALDNNQPAIDSQNAIEAVVHETQTLVNGSTVKLRLLRDIFISGIMIPKDNFVFGIASLNGERLTVKIASIRYRSSLFPVDLSVYDMDGAGGIYIPGAITREVAKESADNTLQSIGFANLDPSIGAQAASAGITAAKSLIGRKVKLVKVTVKAGYQVLLRDEKQKQSN